ncbi:3-carboxymuconate cyclase-like protein-like protein [Bisporella sp. PMI_857]|nr:3-carboxymuconate cyclase-like protein-like protein [Bisporella sp. PMI_857]
MHSLQYLLRFLALFLFIAPSAATRLFVSSYDGNITTLDLSHNYHGFHALKSVAVNSVTGSYPSWITLDAKNQLLYVVDEAWPSQNGSVTSYKISSDGKLSAIANQTTLNGPVHALIYNDGKALALAHFSGPNIGGLTTWLIDGSGKINPLQSLTFTLANPGPAPQDKAHVHQVILDPSGSFILAPDLGADLVRIFKIDPTTSLVTQSKDYAIPAGTGPRHGLARHEEPGACVFVLVGELKSDITAYTVTHGQDSLDFNLTSTGSIYGPYVPHNPVTRPAEIIVTPDNLNIITSSRNDTNYEISNWDPTNSTRLLSDTIMSWKYDYATHQINFVDDSPSYGSWPRHVSINKDGTLVAVTLQFDQRVVLVERDPKTGHFGDSVADIVISGGVNCIIWDE